MDINKFNYHSPRSEKAHIGVKISHNLQVFLSTLGVFMMFFGIIMIISGLSLGWVLAGFSIVPVMIVEWCKGELCNLKVSKNIDSVDEILSSEVLGRLSSRPTPKELAGIVGALSGGYFFTIRFGVGGKFLQELASDNPDDISKVWEEAIKLRDITNSDSLSATILTVAIIRCYPNYQSLLGHLQLSEDDLVQGIKWHKYLLDLIEIHHTPKRTGGIARDWSFGWTPLLNRFGQNISEQIGVHDTPLIQLAVHKDSLEKLVDIFSKNGRQNAALIGQLGVGKTEIVTAFASRLLDAKSEIPSGLKFRQIFILDAASLIAAASDRGGLERLVPRILNEAYLAKNVILCLDNAQLFFQEGVGSVDISNILLPVLKGGGLRMILTMDDQKYLQINKTNPEIANVLNRINVEPATREETISVMQDRLIMIEFANQVTFMYQAILEAYNLAERYVHDMSMPGKAIKVLESAANYAEDGLVTAASVQQAIEKTFDVKVGVASRNDEREKLLNLENLIHERMINQSRAVQVVSDAIRRARAGVRNQDRPIGTFLFLGPTGVGKTELSKALADVYFGGEDRIIRLDMNEYVTSDDAKRLIADGTKNPNSLTAKAMKQPFSVILLDEIEKAHSDVLSILLQLLDEGILRDEKNREVSFRDTIIIATSNAGADRIREYIERGYDLEQFEDKFVDELISSNQFRPEFLNRFDEIVLFRPLNKEELIKVIDLMLIDVNRTLSSQKITVEVAPDAKEYLVEAGYDPRLGARPMRRIIQKTVENTVAKMMLSGDVNPGSKIEISLDQVKQLIETKNTADRIIDGSSAKV